MKKSLLLIGASMFVFAACLPAKPATEEVMEKDDSMMVADDSMMEKDSDAMMKEAPEGATVYAVNTEETVLQWKGTMIGKRNHIGTVSVDSGEVYMTDDNMFGGHFGIDMNTITTDDGDTLIKHLKSADFFEVEMYPTAKFEITSVEPTTGEAGSDGEYTVNGNLTIKGKTNPISFPATVSMTDEGATITASFEIDRSLWEVKYGSASFFDNLKDEVISDQIEFELTLVVSNT